ncbi:MAG: F-type H+-transporting ATPase subunit epsilon [Chloroflexi bacterium]|jgi:F-type H+-transporting ATPase subunit epsilon|nr:MAG: F-type H+-transporting ATPase subunit epsilon [Chloroflexota bacterium]
MQLDIVTAEGSVYSGEVNAISAPGVEGELGVLSRHAPLLTVLQPGELRLRIADQEDLCLAVSGGFLEVMSNDVTVLADTIERSDEIDEQRAEEALKRAEERISGTDEGVDLQRAVASMKRSKIRIDLVRKRRHRGDPSS